jgi:hypothetical protein
MKQHNIGLLEMMLLSEYPIYLYDMVNTQK